MRSHPACFNLSMPRSPRATMISSLSSIIASVFLRPSSLSIFGCLHARSRDEIDVLQNSISLFATETTPMIVGALPTRAAQAPPSGLLTQASGACRTRSCAQLHLQPPANYEKEKDDAALAKQVRLARALGKRFPRECTRHRVTERRISLPP